MKLVVVVVGGVKGPLRNAVAGYETRASHYWKLEVVEVTGGAPGRSPDPDRVRRVEAERILSRLSEDMEYWALTRKGKLVSSRGLARLLGQRASRDGRDVTIVVGGAFGLDPQILSGASRRLSLGALTLPHEMARLILAEQLYRAGTILRNEPYHKGGSG